MFSAPIIIIAGLLLYLVLLLRMEYFRLQDLRHEKHSMELALAGQAALSDKLSKEAVLLDTPEYLSLFTRERLGFVRKGEKPFKIFKGMKGSGKN